jgi:hypothetical protein
MRIVNWVSCVFAGGLAGCSLYPIPDDVSPFRTEEIVRYGRCEVRNAILAHMVNVGIITTQSTVEEIRSQIEAATKKAKAKKDLRLEEKKLLRLTKVAVVYSFDFNIIENNRTGADAGFRLPWPATNVLDVGATAALDLTRQGSRVFGNEDSWDDLITNSSLCEERPWQRPGNIVYPLTGSIGVGRVVETFIDIDEQGGAKDNFVDTLTFTTVVSGGANAAVKLDPVPNQFRLVSATAAASASRLDIHKLTVSLAFPQPDPRRAITGVVRVDGDLNAPFTRPAAWRARYNLCVQDARTRENTFRILRLEAPEVYCIRYADAFAPQTGFRAEQPETMRRVGQQRAAPKALNALPADPAFAPPPTRFVPQIRPNAPP